jgi:hypothetical protein
MKLILAIVLCGPAFATTYPAATCNSSDVIAAITSANAGSGNTVTIPSGTCSWTNSNTIPSSGTLNSMTIIGNTTTSCNSQGSCTATDDTTINVNGQIQYFLPGAGTTLRVSGITLGSTGAVTNSVFSFQGPSSGTAPQVRFDHSHCVMSGNADTCFSISSITGVADHDVCDEETSSEGNCIRFYYPLNGDSGDQSWANVSGLGTGALFYVELSTFNHGVANDGQEGARYVFRYDTLNDSSIQTHPTGCCGDSRGARAWEIYNNVFTASSGCMVECGNVAFISSGTGLVWGNTANNDYGEFISLHSDRIDSSTYPQTATPNGWGYCGTNFTGTGSKWDQNTSTASGYSCIDQPGSGKGDLLSGSFPTKTNSTTGTIAWPHQALEPIYEWLNSWNGTTGNYWPVYNNGESSNCTPSCTGGTALASNRDFYLWCNASSNNGCTTYNGTGGTGSGLLSARPSTCTSGVGYWATDTSTLYQCSATNTWSAYYTPYTYPHPLTQGTTVAPPTNLSTSTQ